VFIERSVSRMTLEWGPVPRSEVGKGGGFVALVTSSARVTSWPFSPAGLGALVPLGAGPSALESCCAGTDGDVTSLRVCSEPERVAVNAGRTERAEYPGGIVVPLRR